MFGEEEDAEIEGIRVLEFGENQNWNFALLKKVQNALSLRGCALL